MVPFCAHVMRYLLMLATSRVLFFWDAEASAMGVLLVFVLFAVRVMMRFNIAAAIAEFVADAEGLISFVSGCKVASGV